MVSAIIIAIFFTVYTASAFSSGAKLFATLFGNAENYNTVYTIGLIVAVIVILVYTFLGGFKAVCYTDFIQGLLMLVAIMAVPIIAYVALTYNNSFSQSLIDSGVTNPDNYLNFFKMMTVQMFLPFPLFLTLHGDSVTLVCHTFL